MAEEHTHGLAHGHHEGKEEHKDRDRALYWSLGLGAAGLVVALLFFMGGGSKKSNSQPTVVNASQPFIPNPTDVSIGLDPEPLFWPGLPTSGTPSKPKTHHNHDSDHDNDAKEKKSKKKKTTSHNTSNDKKGYGKSPQGASHGHKVSPHNVHNPKTVETKGHSNG